MMSILPIAILAADDLPHDVVPPVEYSLIPTWVVFAGCFVGLTILGLLIWWLSKRKRPALPPQLPREGALAALERIRHEIEQTKPYQFSIHVSDILRRYVTEQYALPVTRQTSVEFLNSLAKAPSFSGDEKLLLEDFLSRCDLIKFARYDATTADSQLLLDEATRFVKGGQVATALA